MYFGGGADEGLDTSQCGFLLDCTPAGVLWNVGVGESSLLDEPLASPQRESLIFIVFSVVLACCSWNKSVRIRMVARLADSFVRRFAWRLCGGLRMNRLLTKQNTGKESQAHSLRWH
jgi:hypothetical protein